jgi:hypothetical protein
MSNSENTAFQLVQEPAFGCLTRQALTPSTKEAARRLLTLLLLASDPASPCAETDRPPLFI